MRGFWLRFTMALQDAKIVRLHKKHRSMAKHKTTPKPATAAQHAAVHPTTDTDGVPPGERPIEHGGPRGLEPTRYGDWERNGKCVDF
jgi:hypothetical protein